MPSLFCKNSTGKVDSFPLFEEPAIDCLFFSLLWVKLKGKRYYALLDSDTHSNIRFNIKNQSYSGVLSSNKYLMDAGTAIMHDNYTISIKEWLSIFQEYQNMKVPTLKVLPYNLAVNVFREKTPTVLNCPKVEEIQEQSVLCRGALNFNITVFWAPNLVKIKDGAFAENVNLVCISENCDVSNCDKWGLEDNSTIVTWDRSKKLNLKLKRWENFSGGVENLFNFLT